MAYRKLLSAACLSSLLLACGGEAALSNGGLPRGNGGLAGNGGSSSAGAANIAGTGGSTGGGGGVMGRCAAFPVCPTGERTATPAECPGLSSCHELTICDSTIWCVISEATSDAGSGRATFDCHGETCTATQACIAFRTVGGPIELPEPDAGTCPDGQHREGFTCSADFSYECVELRGACANEPLACACAQPSDAGVGVCPTGYGYCSEPGSDVTAELICEQHSNAL